MKKPRGRKSNWEKNRKSFASDPGLDVRRGPRPEKGTSQTGHKRGKKKRGRGPVSIRWESRPYGVFSSFKAGRGAGGKKGWGRDLENWGKKLDCARETPR